MHKYGMRNKYIQLQQHRICRLLTEESNLLRKYEPKPKVQQGDTERQVYEQTMVFRHSVEASIDRYVKSVSPLIGEHRARHEVGKSLMRYVESNDWSLAHSS